MYTSYHGTFCGAAPAENHANKYTDFSCLRNEYKSFYYYSAAKSLFSCIANEYKFDMDLQSWFIGSVEQSQIFHLSSTWREKKNNERPEKHLIRYTYFIYIIYVHTFSWLGSSTLNLLYFNYFSTKKQFPSSAWHNTQAHLFRGIARISSTSRHSASKQANYTNALLYFYYIS